MRGVTIRGMNDGGDEERVMVDEYQRYARACNRWPRTADMLERMAAGWKCDAEREDLAARQRRLRASALAAASRCSAYPAAGGGSRRIHRIL